MLNYLHGQRHTFEMKHLINTTVNVKQRKLQREDRTLDNSKIKGNLKEKGFVRHHPALAGLTNSAGKRTVVFPPKESLFG